MHFTAARDCESAYRLITDPTRGERFDLVFLDLSLPPYPEQQITSGADLAVLIREQWKDTKLAMLTSHSESILLYNLVQTVNPEGLLVKSDFTALDLLTAFDQIMAGKTYYTQTVIEGLRHLRSREKYLDNTNRKIILLLSQGVRTKDLYAHLNISKSAVEKRKAFIREYFALVTHNDEDIVIAARKLGLV